MRGPFRGAARPILLLTDIDSRALGDFAGMGRAAWATHAHSSLNRAAWATQQLPASNGRADAAAATT